MFRNRAGTSLAFVAAAAMLIAASGGHASPAHAFSGHERGYERPDSGWRPVPPAVHGFWGQRRWQRYNHDFGFRAPPRWHRGYDHGWR